MSESNVMAVYFNRDAQPRDIREMSEFLVGMYGTENIEYELQHGKVTIYKEGDKE